MDIPFLPAWLSFLNKNIIESEKISDWKVTLRLSNRCTKRYFPSVLRREEDSYSESQDRVDPKIIRETNRHRRASALPHRDRSIVFSIQQRGLPVNAKR